MRKLITLVLFLIAGIAILGYYQGWFLVSTNVGVDGKQHIDVTVDKDKINSDKQKVKDEVKELKDKTKDKAAETTPR